MKHKNDLLFSLLALYSMSRDIKLSLKTANAAAGVSTKYNSFKEYNNLKEDADRFID